MAIAALIGLLLFGPFGALIGACVAYLIQKHLGGGRWRESWQQTVQQVFFRTTFLVLGHLAKADGRVSEHEIATARRIMAHLGLTDNAKQQAIRYFNQGKQPDFDLDRCLKQFRQCCWFRPAIMHTFLDFLYQMASADNGMSYQQRQILQHISQQLGIQHQGQYEEYQSQQNYGTFTPQGDSLKNAYKLLNISQDASHNEIKKAYRRQMSKNHPDRLIAKGVPESMIKLATEKTQRIKQAYEDIRAAKGF